MLLETLFCSAPAPRAVSLDTNKRRIEVRTPDLVCRGPKRAPFSIT